MLLRSQLLSRLGLFSDHHEDLQLSRMLYLDRDLTRAEMKPLCQIFDVSRLGDLVDASDGNMCLLWRERIEEITSSGRRLFIEKVSELKHGR
jgi:hypothetical protein